MADFKTLILSQDGAVLTATVARPEALNALNAEVMKDLSDLLAQLQTDPAIRVLILTGQGEKAFVAGADIKQFETMDAMQAARFAAEGQTLMTQFSKLPQAVIAAVNGFALGGGLELALACDFILASENSKFALPECTLGLIPGYGGTVRLPRRVGTAKALEMAMTGSMIAADEALRVGLVNRVVPAQDLMKVARELAVTIASRAPLAISLIKRSIYNGQERGLLEADRIEASSFGQVFETSDAREGVRAFLEKRKPQFQGR